MYHFVATWHSDYQDLSDSISPGFWNQCGTTIALILFLVVARPQLSEQLALKGQVVFACDLLEITFICYRDSSNYDLLLGLGRVLRVAECLDAYMLPFMGCQQHLPVRSAPQPKNPKIW